LLTVVLADTVNEGRGKIECRPAQWVYRDEVFTWSERRWCAAVLCGGRSEGAVEIAVDGELVTTSRATRAERRLD
jgi:hypothetical protein